MANIEQKQLTEALDVIKKWLPEKDADPVTAIIGVAVIMIVVGLTLFTSWLRRRQLAALEDGKRKLESEIEDIKTADSMKESEERCRQLQMLIDHYKTYIDESKKREEKFSRTVDKAIEQLKEVKTWSQLDNEFDRRS